MDTTTSPNPLHQVPRLDSQLCFALYSTSLAMNKLYRKLLRKLGLTYSQYLVMMVLWERDGLTVSEVGERLFLDSGTLTPLLKRLEQRAWVQRRRSAGDEREVHLSLSEAGMELRDHTHRLKARLLCDCGIDLNQADALRDGLDQLLGQLREGSSSAPIGPAGR